MDAEGVVEKIDMELGKIDLIQNLIGELDESVIGENVVSNCECIMRIAESTLKMKKDVLKSQMATTE